MIINEHRHMIVDQITSFVSDRFHGDYKAAFDDYDINGDGLIDKAELKRLLTHAGIGSGLTRWLWADGIIAETDMDGDGAISWQDFIGTYEAELRN
ncbi:EF-hand domain-containing protein [Zavarzinella formosa]|uniref:EF-hand domain-containing protein n=1 Tax=Zavarzinella formosa TaxID=360055 RepID=UPI0003023124|nr:EF-hand domain-containing protein [Zavarzinella formosa]